MSVAEQLFLRDGIESITIADIAYLASVTRATIYRYFANRLEIAWAIQKRYRELFQATLPAEVYDESLPVVQRLQITLTTYRDYLFLFPTHAQYFVQFDTVYASSQDIQQIQELNRNVDVDDEILMSLIRLGIRNGSLRADLDPITIAVMMYTMLRGVERKFVTSKDSFELEFGCSARIVYTNACAVLLRGIVA